LGQNIFGGDFGCRRAHHIEDVKGEKKNTRSKLRRAVLDCRFRDARDG
jgi:hypothetical protein